VIQATRNRWAGGLFCGVEYNSVSQRATGRQADALYCRVHGPLDRTQVLIAARRAVHSGLRSCAEQPRGFTLSSMHHRCP
jgi:hypothetical protein